MQRMKERANIERSTPCDMGVRIQPMPALWHDVRGDCLRDMNYPLTLANCMQSLLACNVVYELG